jgi:hypothetical protein
LTRCSERQPLSERGYFATKKWTTLMPAAVMPFLGTEGDTISEPAIELRAPAEFLTFLWWKSGSGIRRP